MNSQPAASPVEQQPPGLVRVASDELLLLGARLHDDIALGVLYDRYGPEVYGLALGVLRDRDAAEAAVHDVFLRCWRGVEIYDAARGTTHDWLLGIARSRSFEALNALRSIGGGEAIADALRSAVSRDDDGLLAPESPPSGIRERLLARARVEADRSRGADAPTVVITPAETDRDFATAETLAIDAPTTVVPLSETRLPRTPGGETPPTEPPVAERPLAEPPVAETLTSEAPTLTDLPVLGPSDPETTASVVHETDLAEPDEQPTMTVPASPPLEDRVTEAATPPASVDEAAPDSVPTPVWGDDPITATGPVLGPAVPDEAGDARPAETVAFAQPAAASGSGEPVAAEAIGAVQPGADDGLAEEPATIEAGPSSDVALDRPTIAASPLTKAESAPGVPVSEALAAALAPIPPRRGGRQQPRPAVAAGQAPVQPDAPENAAAQPPRRRVKLISIFWAIALLFVIAVGLFVATWSATGPHISPDLAILARMPSGRVITLRAMGAQNADARLYLTDGGRRAELGVDGMPPLPTGMVYQAWIAEAGQPIRSAGSFYVSRKGDAVVPATVGIPAERIQAIFITQESAPGTLAPSGPRLLQWAP
jgi:DNA-directed RNA polymerase specialized sigma24 family protein